MINLPCVPQTALLEILIDLVVEVTTYLVLAQFAPSCYHPRFSSSSGFQVKAIQNWLYDALKLVELALLQIIKEDLLLLSITHTSKLGKLVHLEYRKRLLIILLCFFHVFELLEVMHTLNLTLLVLAQDLRVLLLNL